MVEYYANNPVEKKNNTSQQHTKNNMHVFIRTLYHKIKKEIADYYF